MLLVSPPVIAADVADYRRGLAEIAASLRAGDVAGARRTADGLRQTTFAFAGDSFEADASLLERVRAARSPEEARRAAAAVERLLAALDAEAGRGQPAAPGDAALLGRLQDDLRAGALTPGGNVPLVNLEEPGFFRAVRERIRNFTRRLGRWLWRLIDRFFDWLFRRGARVSAGGGLDARLVTVLVVALAVLGGLLALLIALRRRRRGAVPAAAAAPAFELAADADPLSRRGSEWEERAAELAAAGRFREAVRARFHGVLVALYAGGWLHYRKGRTNWEYVAALSPALPWRRDFVRLTRTFEAEWYGHDESGEEAYARASEEAERVLAALQRREAA